MNTPTMVIAVPFILLWFYVAWLIFEYWFTLFRALAHALPRRKAAYLFWVSMWNFSRAGKCLKPSGLIEHQLARNRALRAAKIIILSMLSMFFFIGSFWLADYTGWREISN